MEIERLNFEYVLTVIAEYLQNPADPEKAQVFDELKSKTIVKTYLPLQLKGKLIDKLIKDVTMFPNQSYDILVSFETCCIFDILMAYTNMGPIDLMFKDAEYYDLMWASGYCDYILNYCSADYQRTIAIANRYLDYKNLYDILDKLSGLDSTKLEDLNNSIEKIKLEIKPEEIHDLATIVNKNSELTKGIEEIITDYAAKMAKKMDLAEDKEAK